MLSHLLVALVLLDMLNVVDIIDDVVNDIINIVMSHLLVALVLLDMLEHGDESLLERRLPKLMVFYNGLLDYCQHLIL